jgi:hypothetical protein
VNAPSGTPSSRNEVPGLDSPVGGDLKTRVPPAPEHARALLGDHPAPDHQLQGPRLERKIDEVALYARALEPAEVARHFEAAGIGR